MKNLLTALIALLIGLGIGYLLWGKDESNITERKLNDYLSSKENTLKILAHIFGPHQPTKLSERQVIRSIDSLYTNMRNKPNFINKTINPSYVFNLKPLLTLAASKRLNPIDLQMRLFPAFNDSTKAFSIIVGLENDSLLFHADNEMFDYIGPCPRNCPEKVETGVINRPKQADVFTKLQWAKYYSDNLGRKLEFNK